MLLTEEEAKTKICPTGWQKVSEKNIASVGCNASGCMAWRWNSPEHIFGKTESGEIGSITNLRLEGFCGLAGKPE